MAIPSKELHNLTRVTADAAITGLSGKRVWAIELYGTTDAAKILLYDAASATGTEVYGLVAPFTDSDASAAESVFRDFTPLGGIPFPNTGIYADITGTGAVAYVWWS